jgi:hypothetical protein
MAMGNQYNLVIQQGATLSLAITWKDSTGTAINLTGYTARMQARSTYDTATAILSLTSAAGDIVLGGVAGTITITASATVTAALTAPWSGVWDLELVSGGGVVTRLLEGAASVSPEVTR